MYEVTGANAAQHGHLDILIWARDNECEWDPDHCLRLASLHFHYEIVEWIVSNR